MPDYSAFKNKIRLIALDLDGTLLNSDGKVSGRTLSSLMRAADRGAKIVLVSGRPPQGLVESARTLSLLSESYAVCFNGSMLLRLDDFFTHGDKPKNSVTHSDFRYDSIFEVSSPLRDIAPVFESAVRNGLDRHAYSATRYLLIENDNEYALKECRVAHAWQYTDFSTSDPDELYYKFLIVGEASGIDAFRQSMDRRVWDVFDVMQTDKNFLEFIPHKYNKGRMLLKLCEILGYSGSEAAAFGDGENDLSMLNAVGLGVCMANGMDVLKNNAKFITGSNDEDGVAMVLDEIFD